jgi:hypothetical protein
MASEKRHLTRHGKSFPILFDMPGYCSHQLHKCMAHASRFILLVNRETLENIPPIDYLANISNRANCYTFLPSISLH